MDVQGLGKQEAKSLKAKDAICRAAISCLVEFGYAETSITRVAERASLSKGALQHHFPTKEELIAAVVETLLARPLARAHTVRPESGRADTEIIAARLRSGWTDFVNTGSYRALLEILVAARTDGGLRNRIDPILQTWNRAHDAQTRESYEAASGEDDDVELLMVMHRALLRGLVVQDRYVSDPSFNARVVERWISIVAPMLRPRRR
ncbi:TetR/AcrR family transcriptional regulator [Bradyrhizobium erythrophlei]|uniref:TetR/AcrR family transcriptional regulator n=1 Tax=Bradyrhizobium erythrophlei TaxID=1437360 RepID=UPI0035EFB0A4